jgi:hypothetical protein
LNNCPLVIKIRIVVNVQSDFPDLCSQVHVDIVIKISHCSRECNSSLCSWVHVNILIM